MMNTKQELKDNNENVNSLNDEANTSEGTEGVNAKPTIVGKDGTLDLLPMGTTIYIPYINIALNIFEVRECIIEGFSDDINESGEITLSYTCTVQTPADAVGKTMNINVCATLSTSPDGAEKELQEFFTNQIANIEQHNEMLKEQLKRNEEHLKLFTQNNKK